MRKNLIYLHCCKCNSLHYISTKRKLHTLPSKLLHILSEHIQRATKNLHVCCYTFTFNFNLLTKKTLHLHYCALTILIPLCKKFSSFSHLFISCCASQCITKMVNPSSMHCCAFKLKKHSQQKRSDELYGFWELFWANYQSCI